MRFTTNHDEDYFQGTTAQRLGPAAPAFAVMTFALPGMPLLYTGQEAGVEKAVAFYEPDSVRWRPHPAAGLYRALIRAKKANPALWNGAAGGNLDRIPNSEPRDVLSFLRWKEDNRVFAVFNLSGRRLAVRFEDRRVFGEHSDPLNGGRSRLHPAEALELGPWAYRLFTHP
jgi:glycosidase